MYGALPTWQGVPTHHIAAAEIPTGSCSGDSELAVFAWYRQLGDRYRYSNHTDRSVSTGKKSRSRANEYIELILDSEGLPGRDDAHVIESARRCRASVLVTGNVKHFPLPVLMSMDVEVKRADEFIADTIDLDPLLALGALARMRERFQNPQQSADTLPLYYESQGFMQTADLLWPYY